MYVVLAAGAAPDLSLLGLVKNADPVVQAIMAGLVLCSIACWAIIIEKGVRLMRLGRDIAALEHAAAGPASPLTSHPAGTLLAALGEATDREMSEGGTAGDAGSSLRDRIEMAMRTAMRTELKRLESGLPFLATVGSASPFIGLFGTVWGIMHSFTAIAQSKDTSLSVVAPGIAEALFATAIGLAAAIPAVIAYNQIAVSLGRAGDRISTAISALARRRANALPESQPLRRVRAAEG